MTNEPEAPDTTDGGAAVSYRVPRQSPPNRLRFALLLVLFAIGFLAAGSSIYWFVARKAAVEQLRLQLARESLAGRLWSCASMKTGGYPLAVDIDCENPTLQMSVEGQTTTIIARRAVIAAPLYTPKLVVIDLFGPANYAAGATRARLDWNALQFSTRGLPDRLDRLSVVGDGAVITSVVGSMQPLAKFSALQLHVRRTAVAPGALYNLTLGVAGVESSALDLLTGSKTPALMTAVGSITQLDSAAGTGLLDRVEAWRAAGGRLTLALISLTKGPLAVQAEGAGGLDQQRRLDGRFDFTLHDAGPATLALARQAGLFASYSLAEAIAEALIGKSGDVKFGVAFENGDLSIGPLKRLSTLPPLY